MRGWGIAAAVALVWVLLGLPIIPPPVAETIGWQRFFWLEFAAESAVAIAPAAAVAARAERWNALPALWAYATAAVVALGGAGGAALMWRSYDAALRDTYYAVVHLRHVSRIGALLSLFTLFYALFPRTNRMLAGAQLALMFLGIVGNFLAPLVFMQFAMPKRYSDYPDVSTQLGYISSITAAMAGLGLLVFVAVLVEAFIRRRPQSVL